MSTDAHRASDALSGRSHADTVRDFLDRNVNHGHLRAVQALDALVAELEQAKCDLRESAEWWHNEFRDVEDELAEARGQVASLRDALEAAATCTGPYGLGQPKVLCPECARKVRVARAVPSPSPVENTGMRGEA